MMTSIKMRNIPKILMHDAFPGMIPIGKEVTLFLSDFNIFSETPLSEEERKRGALMSSAGTREAFLAGRRLVRNVLSHWLSVDPVILPIHISSAGKPYLSGDSVPFFSITHSGGLVMAAFSAEQIGADLELERPIDTVALASRFFSNQEALLMSNEKNEEAFFRLWTCREAAIKGDGRGMGKLLSLTKGKAASKEEGGGSLSVEIESESWSVEHWTIGMMESRYHLALATKVRPSLIRWCDLR